MKKFNKIFAILAFVFLSASVSYAGPVAVKTVQLASPITTSGYVKVVVKLNDSFVGKECGIIVHEDETELRWDYTLAAGGLWIGAPSSQTYPIEAMGYDGNTGAWKVDAVKEVAKNEQIAIWLKVDMTGATQTHGFSLQRENETAVTELYTDIDSRGFNRGKITTSSQAKYCTIFWNDALGINTQACIEVVEDPVVVSSVAPHTFATAVGDEIAAGSVSVFPTLVKDELNISSADAISSVKIFSITGQQVFESQGEEVISLSGLNSGAYIVEVITVNDQVSKQKIIKE